MQKISLGRIKNNLNSLQHKDDFKEELKDVQASLKINEENTCGCEEINYVIAEVNFLCFHLSVLTKPNDTKEDIKTRGN